MREAIELYLEFGPIEMIDGAIKREVLARQIRFCLGLTEVLGDWKRAILQLQFSVSLRLRVEN